MSEMMSYMYTSDIITKRESNNFGEYGFALDEKSVVRLVLQVNVETKRTVPNCIHCEALVVAAFSRYPTCFNNIMLFIQQRKQANVCAMSEILDNVDLGTIV